MRDQRGFTLIEILCALAILALVLGVSLRILSGSGFAAGAAASTGQALAVAQSHLAVLQAEARLVPGDRQGMEGPIRWHDSIEPAGDPAFERAKAEKLIAWRLVSVATGPDGREVRLETVRLDTP